MVGVYRFSRFYLLSYAFVAAFFMPLAGRPTSTALVALAPVSQTAHKELATAHRSPTHLFSKPARKFLIWGATRNVGYSLAAECGKQGIPATLLVRPQSAERARELCEQYASLQIVTGDCTAHEECASSLVRKECALCEAAHDCTDLFVDQEFPYKLWATAYKSLIQNAVHVAQQKRLRLTVLGRPYIYETKQPLLARRTVGLAAVDQEEESSKAVVITDSTPASPAPESMQGRVLAEMEQKLLEGLYTPTPGGNHVSNYTLHIIRTQGIFGPAYSDKLFGDNFKLLAHPEKSFFGDPKPYVFSWIGTEESLNNPYSLLYAPDLARFIINDDRQVEPMKTTVLPGHQFASVHDMIREICAIAQTKVSVSLYSKEKLSFYAMLDNEVYRGVDVFSTFTTPYSLQPSLHLGDSAALYTPFADAVRETIEWYRTHDSKK